MLRALHSNQEFPFLFWSTYSAPHGIYTKSYSLVRYHHPISQHHSRPPPPSRKHPILTYHSIDRSHLWPPNHHSLVIKHSTWNTCHWRTVHTLCNSRPCQPSRPPQAMETHHGNGWWEPSPRPHLKSGSKYLENTLPQRKFSSSSSRTLFPPETQHISQSS